MNGGKKMNSESISGTALQSRDDVVENVMKLPNSYRPRNKVSHAGSVSKKDKASRRAANKKARASRRKNN
jgi:hypothetical protein